MNPRIWSTLGLLGVLGIVPAFAGEVETPDFDPSLGTIAVKIKTIGPTPISIRPLATAVYFVSTDSDTSLVLKREVLVSDFNDKNQVYLFNTPPGKYAAVGAFTPSASAPSQSVYFDSTTIAATEITVEPGKIAFMGDMVVKVDFGMGKADAVQNHFGDLVGRGNAFYVNYSLSPKVSMAHTSSGTTTQVSWNPSASVGVTHMTRAGRMDRISRDPEHERAFWKMATKKVFAKKPEWQKLAQERLDALQ